MEKEMTCCDLSKKKMRGRLPSFWDDKNLADIIFSWSLEDIENECLYQVETIPETFHSIQSYLDSFRLPLLEDTRAELLSSLNNISDAPFGQVVSFARTMPLGTSTFFYGVRVDQWKSISNSRSKEPYSTLPGDVLVLSDAKLETASDLERVGRKWTLALVSRIENEENVDSRDKDSEDAHGATCFSIKTPKKIDTDEVNQKSHFVTYLMNITTNRRIWKALSISRDQVIIKQLLHTESEIWKTCSICTTSEAFHDKYFIRDLQAELNESQAEAVLSCLRKVKCNHKSSADLVWGPPGTGKTETVSVLLFTLLRMKRQTLICAPSNVSVKEVASRVLRLAMGSNDKDSDLASFFSLGDMLLFGNNTRLKVTNSDLEQIYLEYRVKRLAECLAPLTGLWPSFASMIRFFEDCFSEYSIFLENELIEMERRKKEKDLHEDTLGSNGRKKSFLEYSRERFLSASSALGRCFLTLCAHLPESFVLKKNVQDMRSLINLLDSFKTLLFHDDVVSEVVEQLFSPEELVGHDSNCPADVLSKLCSLRKECLPLLHSVESSIQRLNLPNSLNLGLIEELCFRSSTLIFCTASSSYKLHSLELEPLEVLVVDEAAQLKECEASIPLQLPFINHAILIGDECQLPATVQSQVSLAAGFGRSLFERLSSLGYPKHLLNVQYRMHPSISRFPNLNFYHGQIIDAPSVKNYTHEKRYLPGPMFGPYSFINVSCGREERADDGPSKRNMVEVGIVMKILQTLSKAWGGHDLRIGVISPYAAQVKAIREKIGKKYAEFGSFTVNVKSVDGFQGGEEDIIILTTVRSNRGGAIGFLSDTRRVNVALTRARHCLWILGNEITLANSNSIWEVLVQDAKVRDCFFNAEDDMQLRNTIFEVKKEFDQLDDLLNGKSELFRNARWKVLFSEYFRKSFRRLASIGTKTAVLNVLVKLSNGWRPKRSNMHVICGSTQMLRQFKVEGLYIICSIDIVRERVFTQVLKVWDVLPLEEIPKLGKRLSGIFEKFTDDFISRCTQICIEGGLEVPKTWPATSEIIRYLTLVNNDEGNSSCSEDADVGCYVENSRVSDSLLLMKFYSLSSRVVSHLLLKDDGGELELPFEVTDEEHEVIAFPRSTFILGRSGTGKTTVLTTKLFNREQVYSIVVDGFSDGPGSNSTNNYPGEDDGGDVELAEKCGEGVAKSILRQLFVTVSPKLCYAIKRQVQRLKSFASGATDPAHGSSVDLEDIDGSAQFKSIPDSFIDISPMLYPLVISFQSFLLMLDKTCGDSYFERFPDIRWPIHGEKGSPSTVFVQSFIRTREVNYDKFCSTYWPHFNSKFTKGLDSSRVYTEIMSHIKGSLQAKASSDWKLEREEYVELSEARVSTLSRPNREVIYDIYKEYEKMKKENGDFDLADLVIDLHVRLKMKKYEGELMDFVYIDEVQDMTMKQIALFKHICRNVEEGFVFAGDTAQTIARGIDFRFEDVRSLFYKEFFLGSQCDAGKGKISKTFQLSQNFRTHAGVLHLAQSVIDLLYQFFPSNVDILSHERSLIFGEVPILVESGNNENAILTIFGGSANSQSTFVGFGADQVILVRDEVARGEIKDYVGKQALVLTILECKGLEFQDVLLYNFFGSSPLKNKWRVVYLYMKEHGLLYPSFSSIPCFDLAKHNILCSELKQLYVAITRTRQRLWICENRDELSEPMFYYWKKRGLVQVRKLDDSLAQGMQVASTPDEWKSQGYKLLQEGNYEMATICFERAGDEHGEKLAKAAGLKATADRMHSSNPEKASVSRRQAAEIFEAIGKAEYAAECFYVLKEYERAGRLYLLCGQPTMETAGECFLLAGCFELAADVYFKAMQFSKCLSACTKGQLFDTGMKYINMRKQLPITDKNIIDKHSDLDRCEQEFLECAALHYYKLDNKGSFMRYVKAFNSTDSMRDFLTTLGCYDELILLEEELGNFVEAASIAKSRGNFLREADLLGKAGDYKDAFMLILRYALSHSLWSPGSRGWPLKEFPDKKELLGKARSFAKYESDDWYEVVSADAEALSSGPSDLLSLKQQLNGSQRQKIFLRQTLLTRKILDVHFHVSDTKYTWDDDMVNDLEQWSADKISKNCVSCETLIHFWNMWQNNIVDLLQYLSDVDMQHAKENQVFEEFCFNYFGVRKEYQNSNPVYVLIFPDADWVRGLDSRSVQKRGLLEYIGLQHFVSAARSYWSAELLAVGMKVVSLVEFLYRLSVKKSMSLFCQSRSLTYVYKVADSLLHSPFLHRKSHDNKELLKFVEIATANFFGFMYPLDWKERLEPNLISLKRSEICGKLLTNIVSGYLSSRVKLSFGKLGQMAMILLGFGKLDDELRAKTENGLNCIRSWENFFKYLSIAPGIESSHETTLLIIHEVLKDTYHADWRREPDYISPDCFMYLVERALILSSYFQGYVLSTKSSAVEWLMHPDPNSRRIENLMGQEPKCAFLVLHLTEYILHQSLGNLRDTEEWVKKSTSNRTSLSLITMRVIMMLFLLYLNFGRGDRKMLYNLLSKKNIASLLPVGFKDALRRGLNCTSFNLVVDAVAEAFTSVGDPLVVVNLGGDPSRLLCPKIVVIDMMANQSTEEMLNVFFPIANKVLEADMCAPQNVACSSTGVPTLGDSNQGPMSVLRLTNPNSESGALHGRILNLLSALAENCASLPDKDKVALEGLFSQFSILDLCMRNNLFFHEIKVLFKEASPMLEELEQLFALSDASGQKVSNGDPIVGKLLDKIRSRTPRMEAALHEILSHHNENTDAANTDKQPGVCSAGEDDDGDNEPSDGRGSAAKQVLNASVGAQGDGCPGKESKGKPNARNKKKNKKGRGRKGK